MGGNVQARWVVVFSKADAYKILMSGFKRDTLDLLILSFLQNKQLCWMSGNKCSCLMLGMELLVSAES